MNARSSTGNNNDHHLCFFTVRGELDKCPYGSNCKHSHDLKAYLPQRSIDIGPRCYMFDTYGQCFFGILCRYGQTHIDSITGENFIQKYGKQIYVESINKYPALLKHFLRRKKYNYTISDRLVKIANKQITKANVAKRNQPDEEIKQLDEQDRSLVDIYYSNLKVNQDEVRRPKAVTNFENSCAERVRFS